MPKLSTTEDFSRHVRISFRKQKIMKLLQARIDRLERGLVEIAAKNRPDLEQQDGYVHAGALVALADSAGGYAALSLLPSMLQELQHEHNHPAARDQDDSLPISPPV